MKGNFIFVAFILIFGVGSAFLFSKAQKLADNEPTIAAENAQKQAQAERFVSDSTRLLRGAADSIWLFFGIDGSAAKHGFGNNVTANVRAKLKSNDTLLKVPLSADITQPDFIEKVKKHKKTKEIGLERLLFSRLLPVLYQIGGL